MSAGSLFCHVTDATLISCLHSFVSPPVNPLPQNISLNKSRAMLCTSLNLIPSVWDQMVQAITNSDFKSALTSGFHTESSKSRSREPSLDMLLLLLLRPALRLGSQ